MSLEQNIERIAAALEAIAEGTGQYRAEAAAAAVPVQQTQAPAAVQATVQGVSGMAVSQTAAAGVPVQAAPVAGQQNRWPDYSRSPAPVNTAPVLPSQQAPPVPAPVTEVRTGRPGYTLDDLARAGMALMDSGRQAELQQLLTRFGVDSLPALQAEQYGAFATALREMGAQI